MSKKHYDHDFKQMILSLHESGQTIKSLSEEYGVSRASIVNWKKQQSNSSSPAGELELTEKNKELEKENARLTEENIVLKKCVGIFSERSKNPYA